MKHASKTRKEMDYVGFYADSMKRDSRIFEQQKRFLESQMSSSASLFKNMLGTKDFERHARLYLARSGVLKRQCHVSNDKDGCK